MRHLLLLLFLLGSAQAAEKPFTMLTDELLAKLPEAQRAEWTAYIAKSRALAERTESCGAVMERSLCF